jgi:hypothetical protein
MLFIRVTEGVERRASKPKFGRYACRHAATYKTKVQCPHDTREEPSIAMGEGAKCNIMSMFPWPPIAEQEEVVEMSSQDVNKARLAKGQ